MTGPEMREIRNRLHLSQEVFGRKFGYHQPQIRISEFERGERKIPFRMQVALLRIQKYFKGEIECGPSGPMDLLETLPRESTPQSEDSSDQPMALSSESL